MANLNALPARPRTSLFFNKLLKKHDIDFEMHTAGEHKRTLTLFGENTEAGRARFRESLEDAHALFKQPVYSCAALLPDGGTSDPALLHDWLRTADSVIQGRLGPIVLQPKPLDE